MIPSEDKIRRALLMELYACSNHAAMPDYIYNQLVDYFIELEDEDFQPYHHSKNRWANTIQVTRNHLVEEGLILTPEQNKRNEWKLSGMGIKVGREFFIAAYEYDPWAVKELTIDNIPDSIVEKFTPLEEEQTFPEGKAKYLLHASKERNKKLVALKKKQAFDKNPNLPCEICGTSFKTKYGAIGEGFIEAHHVQPLSELSGEAETKLEDLILVCSNCHKMIHYKRPWLSIEQIKGLLE